MGAVRATLRRAGGGGLRCGGGGGGGGAGKSISVRAPESASCRARTPDADLRADGRPAGRSERDPLSSLLPLETPPETAPARDFSVAQRLTATPCCRG